MSSLSCPRTKNPKMDPPPSSSSSSSMSRRSYDVFLSFRGIDTRPTFISHLYRALDQKGVYTFWDSEELELGDRRSELFDAIEGSRIAIITFSENYAHSKWCLDELQKIMERKEQGKLTVLPIFYHVSPGEVRVHAKDDGEKGCYQIAMDKMEAKYGKDSEMVKRWRRALWQGGDLIGIPVGQRQDESVVIREVVEKVLKQLNRVHLEVAKYPVGIERHLEAIRPLLHVDPHDDGVYMVGLRGPGGAGKTTLSKAICNDIADYFDDWCFLRDVRRMDLVLSQQTLLRQLLRETGLEVPCVDRGKNLIKERLCDKRVLVILDDVDSSDQLKALAGGLDWFGQGSRVIITTRDRHVLDSAPVQHVHEITLLDKDEAERLFRRHAFKSGQEDKKIDNLLIDSCLIYAAGLPLALKVLGSLLHGRSERLWKSTLEKLAKNPQKDINSVLKISFEGLDDHQKDIFLDIACFFKGWERDDVMKILDSCGFQTLIEMEVLVERCLVTVEDDKFGMHDLLEAMGKSIVCDEKLTGGLPSRIWSYKDFLNVLSDDVMPENYVVQGIVLDLATERKKLINANSFKFSRRLRLLIVRNAFDPKEPLNLPPKLRWLEWPGYSASTIRFGSFSELVGLDMWQSNIKEINGEESDRQTEEEEQEFPELKYVELSNCKSLITLPNLSQSSKLKDLNLSFCENLTWLDESIGSLDELVHLNLEGCRSLSTFPSSLKSRHFRTLNFSGCFKLSKFPAIEEKLHFLTELNLHGTAVKELPDSIVNLVAVKILSLASCKELSIIPAGIGRLKNLEELDLINCENLEEVQGLPPRPRRLYMQGCRRLRTFPRLHTFMSQSPTMNLVNLSGCQNLGSAYMNESLPYQMVRKFQGVATVILPAEEIPLWMNFQTTECELYYRVHLPEGMREDDILGLALSVTFEAKPGDRSNQLFIRSLLHLQRWRGDYFNKRESAHTWFTYHPLQPRNDGRDWSNLTISFNQQGVMIKKCGAHVVCKQEQDDQRVVFCKTEFAYDPEFAHDPEFVDEFGRMYVGKKITQSTRPHSLSPHSPAEVPSLHSVDDRSSYDVFLSFRAPDSCHALVSNLDKALCQKGMLTFKDSSKLEAGQSTSKLFEVIEKSRMAIVIFSENYARSQWCLEELKLVMKHKELGKLAVVPIFYGVSPREVRLHRKDNVEKGRYQIAMEEMEAKYGKDNPELVKSWKEALWKTGDLIGFHLAEGKDEDNCVDYVIEYVMKLLDRVPLEVAQYPIGINARLKEVEPLLKIDQHLDNVHMLGIYGLGGVGKTTLSKAICNDIAHQFDGWCFLSNVRDTPLIKLQKRLLHKLLSERDLNVSSVDEGKTVIQNRLRNKRVLVILDDINKPEQLDALAGGIDWFGKGSRIIITTRNSHLLISNYVQCKYEVKLLDKVESGDLFRYHAFGGRQENLDIVSSLIDRFLVYANGLPLALVLLGRSLYKRSASDWKSLLEKLKKNPPKDIISVLKISFDGLDEVEQEIFLDIACFFKGWDKDYAVKILAYYGFDPTIIINILVERCLVTIEDGKFQMHDLIEAMGKSIACGLKDDEIPNRIWSYDNFCDILSKNMGQGRGAIKGILLNLMTEDQEHSSPSTFEDFKRLRLLIVRNFLAKGSLCFSDELRWFEWPKYSAPAIDFTSSRKLVGIDLRWSKITKIMGKDFKELKYLNLYNCKSLDVLPDLSGSSHLEDLNLSGCVKLSRLDDSIGSLDKLVHLELKDCCNLVEIPSLLRSKDFRTINFSGCSKLNKFPAIKNEVLFLTELNLEKTALKELPDSIGNLVAVKTLNLSFCKELSDIPSSIFKLRALEMLLVSGCPKLEMFPRKIRMDSTDDLGFPNLVLLSLQYCNLKEVEFLRELTCFETLQGMHLSGNGFARVPECISKFRNLEELWLCNCKNLVELPKVPSAVDLHLRGCRNLPSLPCFDTFIRGCSRSFLVDLSNCHILELNYLDTAMSLEKIRKLQESAEVIVARKDFPQWMKFRITDCDLNYTVPLPEGISEDEILGLAVSVTFWVSRGGADSKQEHDFFPEVSLMVGQHMMSPRSAIDQFEGAHTWFVYIPRRPHTEHESDSAAVVNWSDITLRFETDWTWIETFGLRVVCKNEIDDQRFMAQKIKPMMDYELGQKKELSPDF